MKKDASRMAINEKQLYVKRDDVNKATRRMNFNIFKIVIVLIIVINTKSIEAEETNNKNELVKRMKIIESVSGRFFDDIYQNGTFRTGNNLWDNILNQCSVSPSMSCLQKNVYSYMDDKLDFDGDVKVASGLCFKKNNVDVRKYSDEANVIYLTGSKDDGRERYLDEENEVDDNEESGTFRTGNNLWDNILNQCSVSPSVSCLQKNVYSYMDDKLDFDGDVKVASGLCFKKNNVDVRKYSDEANVIYLTGSKDDGRERYLDEENEVDDNEESESPLEEVTDALYTKGVKFLTTHDMRLTLPEMFFDGATLKVSPRALTKTGALVHIDLEPKEVNGESRLFFHKIKKYIRKKLVTAAIAIILVVKLIALKLIFVLPLILGVTTAKKMFLKLLLFIFPALSHIFKLCSWYHQNYHTTKFHHHHHLITHHHKSPHHTPYGHSGPHSPHSSTVVVRPHSQGSAPSFENYQQDWELSGPGLGSEYLSSDIHRNAIATFKPNVNDVNDINAWGLGSPPGQSMNVGEQYSASNAAQHVASPNGQKFPIGNLGRPSGPPNPYYNRNKKNVPKDPLQAEKEALIRAASIAARAPPSPVRDEILRVSAVKLKETNRVKAETELVKQQQLILAANDPETQAAEKFYGGLVDKIDTILLPMGASDPGCRERAVCSLYGDPFKHAPYSNLVSNELSKDSNELLPAADSKMALRYYRYVQAARDGQEQKDCLSLYSHCEFDYNQIRK